MDDQRYIRIIVLLSEAKYLSVTGIAEGESQDDVIIRICAQTLWEVKEFRENAIRDYGIPSPEYDKANELYVQAASAIEKHLPEGMTLQTIYGSKYFSDSSLEITDEMQYFSEAIRSIQELNSKTAVMWADYTPGPVYGGVFHPAVNYMLEVWKTPEPIERPPVGPKPRIKGRTPNRGKKRVEYWKSGKKF